MTAIIIIVSIGIAVLTTMSFVGGIYANREALPMVGVMFVAILLFGLIW